MVTDDRTIMSQPLYEEFSTALDALPLDEMIGALNVAESFVNGACHQHGAGTVLPDKIELGRAVADRLLRVFEGRTVGEVVVLMTRVRDDLADAMALSGVPAEGVREFRERGARIDGHGEAA